jgi:hypothetical protein
MISMTGKLCIILKFRTPRAFPSINPPPRGIPVRVRWSMEHQLRVRTSLHLTRADFRGGRGCAKVIVLLTRVI